MQCTGELGGGGGARRGLILLWPANVMIYGTCGLRELLIKEQHGDQSLIRAAVKGQRKVIKRLRDPAMLTGNQSDSVHCTGNYLPCVRKEIAHFLPLPTLPDVWGFRTPVLTKMDLVLIC